MKSMTAHNKHIQYFVDLSCIPYKKIKRKGKTMKSLHSAQQILLYMWSYPTAGVPTGHVNTVGVN